MIEHYPGGDDGGDSDSHTITIAQVDSLTWETFDDNTDVNNGRIYPGYQNPDDTDPNRDLVTIKATLNCSPSTDDDIWVYFRAWDVDDPLADETNGSLDPDDDDADPNQHSIDNRGSDSFVDGATTWYGVPYINVEADGSNVVEATFNVSMKPGDNYRITATTCLRHIGELDHYKVEQGNLPATVKRSEILTTWRKLWIERDSMEAVATTGGEMNHVEGTALSYDYNSISDQTTVDLGQNLDNPFDDENQFEEGRYVVNGNTYDVIYSTANIFPFDDDIIVDKDCSGEPDDYNLYDDDDQSMYSSAYYCSLDGYTSAYEDACIKTEYLSTSSYSDRVNFNLNLLDTEVTLGVDFDNEQDVWSSSKFWVCLVVSCYQGTYSADMDPDDNTYMDPDCDYGVTRFNSDNASCIFRETLGDVPLETEAKTMAHEVGHTGGGDH